MTKTKADALLDDEDDVDQETPKNPSPKTKELPKENVLDIPSGPPLAVAAPAKGPNIRLPRKAKRDYMEKLTSSLGLSKKLMPRLTRRSSAIYQLVNMKGRIDKRLTGADQFVDPPIYDLVPHYTIIDIGEEDLMRREKTMTFYDGGTETTYITDPVTKKQVPHAVAKIGSPIFINGQMRVDIFKEYAKYAWLELHPRNGSNKWRDRAEQPIFERVDTKWDSPHVQLIRMDMKRDAENYVLGLKTTQLINLAAALTNPTMDTNIDPQRLMYALRMRARENPEEILYTNPNNKGALKILTIQAMDYGALTYIPEHEAYYMDDDEKPIFTVPMGINPFEALVEFLASPEGADIHTELKDEMSFWV